MTIGRKASIVSMPHSVIVMEKVMEEPKLASRILGPEMRFLRRRMEPPRFEWMKYEPKTRPAKQMRQELGLQKSRMKNGRLRSAPTRVALETRPG